MHTGSTFRRLLHLPRASGKNKERRSVCESTGQHQLDPQTWRCSGCGIVVAVMMSPALPC